MKQEIEDLSKSIKVMSNGILLAQQKGAYSLEEAAILYQEIKKVESLLKTLNDLDIHINNE